MSRFRSRFRRRSDGSMEFRVDDRERELMRDLVNQLRDLLLTTAPTGVVDPHLRRLFPTAYPDDERRDADYQELMRGDLLEQRLAQLDLVEVSLNQTRLAPDQAMAWLRALNDLRLVLCTALDVSEDDEPVVAASDDPEATSRAIYHYLGALQSEFISAMSS